MPIHRSLVLVPLFLAAACSSPPSGTASTAPAAAASPQTSPTPLSTPLGGSPGSGSCVPAAPATFANAVCVCDDLSEAGILRTHAPASGAASVGVDGRVAAATGSDIEGGLIAYKGLAVAGGLDVRDAISSTGDVTGAGALDVGGDLSVGGTLSFVGDLQVGGSLRLASPGLVLPARSSQSAPYVAPAGPPCGCDPASLLPIASAVAAAASTNDNAAIGLGTTGADLLGAGDLSLPSGAYYFHDVTRVGAGAITAHGAVAIYIDGSIDEVGVDQIRLDAGASLDLYVSGVIATAGAVSLGDPTRPDAFRLFVGGAGALVATAGAQAWNGLIYAPQARVSFAGVTALNGALFAQSLDWAGVLDVTYDGSSSATSCAPATDAGATSTTFPPADAGATSSATDAGATPPTSPGGSPPSSPSDPR